MTLTSVGRSAHVSVPWPIARGEAQPQARQGCATKSLAHSTRVARAHITCILACLTEKISPLLNEARAKFHGFSCHGLGSRKYLRATKRALGITHGNARPKFQFTYYRSINNNNYLCCYVSAERSSRSLLQRGGGGGQIPRMRGRTNASRRCLDLIVNVYARGFKIIFFLNLCIHLFCTFQCSKSFFLIQNKFKYFLLKV